MGLTDKLRLWRDYPITLYQKQVSSLLEGDVEKTVNYQRKLFSGMLREGVAYGGIAGLLTISDPINALGAFMLTSIATLGARGTQIFLHRRRSSTESVTEEIYPHLR